MTAAAAPTERGGASADELARIVADLYPLRRDLVSEGYDRALAYVDALLPQTVHEFPTGRRCWDWVVPPRWEVRDAWVKDAAGRRVVDLAESPLAVPSYAAPVSARVDRGTLLAHLHTLPERPDAVPYRFFPYERQWGFCMPQRRRERLRDGHYEVYIDAVYSDGRLKVGEHEVRGRSDDVVVVMAHLDHPFQANDDLSGVAVLVDLARRLRRRDNHFTYKFLLVPESIGSIAYLSANEGLIGRIRGGLFLEKLGNDRQLTVQYSKAGDTAIDRAARRELERRGEPFAEGAYGTVTGNDEKVFNATFVDVPMISLTRKPYPEYHSSDDTPAVVDGRRLRHAADVCCRILCDHDANRRVRSRVVGPACLSRHGLRPPEGVNGWRLFSYLDGTAGLADLAEILSADRAVLGDFLDRLTDRGLVEWQ